MSEKDWNFLLIFLVMVLVVLAKEFILHQTRKHRDAVIIQRDEALALAELWKSRALHDNAILTQICDAHRDGIPVEFHKIESTKLH